VSKGRNKHSDTHMLEMYNSRIELMASVLSLFREAMNCIGVGVVVNVNVKLFNCAFPFSH
jgi:hypothetical protein